MSFDGSGNYTVPYTFVYDTVISETEMNAQFADVAAGLSSVITKDGQTTPTANIPMGGYKITLVGDATTGTDALNRNTADARYPNKSSTDAFTCGDLTCEGFASTGIDDQASSTKLFITDAAITKPDQPSFNAYVSSDISDATGDGTTYQVVFDTEVTDTGSDFDTVTGVFTAPVTGRYFLTYNLRIKGIDATSTRLITSIVTSNRTYRMTDDNLANGKVMGPGLTVIADMDAGDTAHVTLQVNGTNKVVDVGGGATQESYFHGELLG